MIHLDTDIAIALMTGRSRPVRFKYRDAIAAGTPIGISAVVVFELEFGVAKSQHQQANATRLATFLAGGMSIVPFDESDARASGELRALLASSGASIGPYDTLIAGQALRHGATLATANVREFSRVTGLTVADWMKP